MLDLASIVFGDFQDNIVSTFGNDLGWLVGHALLLGTISLFWISWINREHIQTESGWNKSTLFDLATIAALTLVQYAIYTGNFGFAATASLGVAFVGSMTARWLINVVN